VYDKYYKFTVKTNESGDYMIFGVPLGSQTIFLDVDLSDIGCFSLSPQDLIQAGQATETQVDGSRFKTSTNLNELPQVKTLNKIVDIAPLWGDTNVCQLGITRVDFDLTTEASVSINPTAVFMGSVVSTTDDDALRVSCKPRNNTGNLCELISGPGQILSIRQTIFTDELGLPILEEHKLPSDGKVIDGDGSYLVNIPMNLDYIYTNEFGEQAISNDPKIGIPTKAKYRFKFKWENEGGLQSDFLRANYFVPNIKEHGWNTSSYVSDPLKTGTVQTLTGTLQPLTTISIVQVGGPGSLINPVLTNVDSFTVFIAPNFNSPVSGLVPYNGDPLTSITGLGLTNTIVLNIIPTDPTLPSSVTYTGVGTTPNPVTFSIPGGPISFYYGPLGNGGIVFDETINVSSYSVSVGSPPSSWTPYYGDSQVITVQSPNDYVLITPTFIDPLQPAVVTYKQYNQEYFDLLKSYSFSLDWDDYVDPQSAINCEDTFYQFHYNKVYTTAMFLDRYKNGVGRAKHLGIKEIDNRSCKSTVNTFPVNDIIRNFDFLFFVFNILMTILTFPILVLLFIAHFIAWIWPVLKYLLIFLGIYLVYLGVDMAIDLVYYILSLTNFNVGGPIISIGTILQIIKQALVALFYIAAGIAFIIFTAKYLIKIENFPRIGLPMLSYPDCTTCDCQCGNADFSEANNLDSNSVNQGITDAQSQVDGVEVPEGIPTSATTSSSFLAPIGQLASLSYTHPNGIQPDDQATPYSGPFYNENCYPGICDDDNNYEYWQCAYKSLSYSIGQDQIGNGVLAAAELSYKRLITGSESLDVGNDTIGIPDKNFLHAPVSILFSAAKDGGDSWRFFGKPYTETYAQKLNEFNLRQKYFDGVNKIKATFNKPQNQNTYHEDQVLVLLAKSGTKNQIGIGKPFSFQDGKLSLCNPNITGTTFFNGSSFTNTNQFGNGAVTGTTATGGTITVNYANPSNFNANYSPSPQYTITYTGDTEDFLKYPVDIEYFQIIEGYTYSDFINQADFTLPNAIKFPSKYLRHDSIFIYYDENDCSIYTTPYDYFTQNNVIEGFPQYSQYEILIIARGVDPHSPPQTNEYDLSIIFGKNYGQGPIVSGEFYLNIPIQGYPSGVKPKSHIVPDNNTAPNLYFKAYNFTISDTYTVSGVTCNQFSGFTSVLPYYYLCPDDSALPTASYIGAPGFQPISSLAPNGHTILAGSPNRGLLLPTISYQVPSQSTPNYYFAGGSMTISNSSSSPTYPSMTNTFPYNKDAFCGSLNYLQKYAVYSPAYYRYNPAPINYTVNQAPGGDQYIVMRSDRLPTSTRTQNGTYGNTGYALHQNDNFTYYQPGSQASPTIGVAPDPSAGQAVYDESQQVQGLTETLNCENMVPLKCYQDSGTSISVNPNCEIPSDRMIQGCYCLLNKDYIAEYPEDARLFLEWKTRFTITFAACRGVFAQTFQNNWINGVLYMFSFNKSTTYSLTEPDEPQYNYCKDTIIFNQLNNGFYYRSSPWNSTTNQFIGVDSPPPNPLWPQQVVDELPGLGYNNKRIQFPTTIMDMGPREEFISQICNDSNFDGYLVDQIKSTSYQDNSDLIQMGFISRLLNSTVRDQMLPISGPGGDTEGKGIIQFFNSNRRADRIDGDFAQALSINSEWKVKPYINENYPDNFLFIGEDNADRPVFGIFFSSSTEEYSYRRNLSFGLDVYTSNCGGVYSYYGYPSDQVVPHYRWRISGPTSNIFGTENNNWNTNVLPSGGFFSKEYQNLDFNTDPYFRTAPNPNPQSLENFGFITNFDSIGDPQPNVIGANPQIVNGQPTESILVGAPFFFYFGLNNGNTAVDKFVKLYLNLD
jgi:hypothetical protein